MTTIRHEEASPMHPGRFSSRQDVRCRPPLPNPLPVTLCQFFQMSNLDHMPHPQLKWLEELASESDIIQAQRYITQPGRLQAATRENNIYVWAGVSMISLDRRIRLGPLCVVQGIGSVHVPVATRCSSKSIGGRLGWLKVPRMMINLTDVIILGL